MRNMKIGRCCLAGLFLWIVQGATAQINYGTTGLMNLPTADMQRRFIFSRIKVSCQLFVSQ